MDGESNPPWCIAQVFHAIGRGRWLRTMVESRRCLLGCLGVSVFGGDLLDTVFGTSQDLLSYQMNAPHSDIVILPATADDIEPISQIWEELMDLHEGTDERFALSINAVRSWQELALGMIDRIDGFLLVARLEGKRSGFCLGWVARNPPIYRMPEIGFISEIAVARVAQHRGVGRALMHAAIDFFLRRGLTELQLSTAVWNEKACDFWESLGGEPLLTRYHFDLQESSNKTGAT